jgi:hypothetical protein
MGDVVHLVGGPMDGWDVTPTADALKPDWPPPHPRHDYGAGPGKWGHYGPVEVGTDGVRRSAWIPDGQPA